ncbi:MAG: 2Fe-2S ferredoxin [Rickettsiales bacterium]|nr:2Fe-2S ferredoxin [Rickettsiales bacterium]|tara:strand:- start:1403 stop:1732 length:330 start_codon:yes stop_codon:yes gene_type:complete
MTKIIFIEDGKEKTVEAQNGLSILEVAHNNGINLEGACEGSLACSTCHVVVEKKFFDELPEPSEEEEDMLDLAWGLTHTSRLGCQIIIDEKLEGMKVTVPSGTRNMSVE